MKTVSLQSSRTIAIWLAAVVIGGIVGIHPSAQRQDRVPVRRPAHSATAAGTVPVVVHLAVPGITELTGASAAVPGSGISAAQAEQRDRVDGALRDAIARTADRVLEALPERSYVVNNRYASIPFIALRVSDEALAALAASPLVAGIEDDVATELVEPVPRTPVTDGAEVPQLNGTIDLIGARTAWSWGFTGAGWYVAVLDTGIRTTHQFFAGKSIVEACFAKGDDGISGAGDCPNGQWTQIGQGSAVHHPTSYSTFDHGTHVAGIAAGNAGSLAGVAKQANIIAVQVFSRSPASSCSNNVPCLVSWGSDSLAALDWVYSMRGTYAVASVNLSLGGGLYGSPCDGDSRKAAVDNLRNAGIATVIAAGNNESCGSISAPACISSSVAVASSTDFDSRSSFSNWHPSMVSLFAPGSSIYSSTGTSDSGYASWNGTSMATPHVAGAWALMKHALSNGSVPYFLDAFRSTGVPVASGCDSRDPVIPRLQVDRAIAALVRYRLILESSALGTTNPAPGTYVLAAGTQVQIAPIPETHVAFVGWSGSVGGAANPLTLTMNGDKTVTANFRFVFAPAASGRQVVNRSLTQAEYINVISWQANPANQGINITRYRVYSLSGGKATLVVEVGADQSEFVHRHIERGSAQYTVAAVTHDNREGASALVSIQ